ncbi:MAG: ATP-binding domain-containing protein [Clostridia bacterium]|nr:ATP-binding domain-containing protein [Clostridia bacterium]MBR2176298.1 ATP-binding domain-containing protein [Clostridia bacterium]
MNNITLAYSITIHKSQGSEYKSVIIPMLKRNLLYTAVTRAKSRVILVGQRQAIFMAVNKTETDQRNTLGKRI